MALIKNLEAFHAAIAALAPIDGVAADGTIFFQKSATPAQIAAANAAASSFVDPPIPAVPDLSLLVQELAKLGVLPPASVAAVHKPAPQAAPVPATSSLPSPKPITEA
jgi:hypothetical protein